MLHLAIEREIIGEAREEKMRVFVTGATGFIGFAIVEELIGAGHEVLGLARSEASAKKLRDAGASVQIGSVEDLACLRQSVGAADGAIHTAFYHKVSHIPLGMRLRVMLGGAPGGIVQRLLGAAVKTDRLALETLGNALAAKGGPLVAAFGTLSMKPGQLATEDDTYDPDFLGAERARTEDTLHALAARGVRTSAIRLSPIVHGAGDHGFAPQLITIARKKNESAYIGDGHNRWPSVHQRDAARLFRLALENGPAGGTYHGVAEEGIPFRDIAELIGRRLKVPVVSKSQAAGAKQFGFLDPFISIDNPTSSQLTQERLGWNPTQPGLLSDLEQADYFKA
jgi:nucleoside-diphosphate-sugar epimerase